MQDSLEMGWKERTVTVERSRLLETLKANRQKHCESYKQAIDGYKVMALKQVEEKVRQAGKRLDDARAMLKAKIDRFDPDDPLQDQVILLDRCSFLLEVPKDHTKSYDVAIQMAEWEVGDTIELTQSQFQCFVLDDWDWKSGFEKLSKSYHKR